LARKRIFKPFFEDDEIEAVMERTNVGLLEAAEAMQTCDFQPRKAILFIESQTNAGLSAEKKAAEQAYKEIEQEQEKKVHPT
jgi:N-acetylmuramic acid 6-phosphate (MurNAc-6-P) etherase